MAKRKRATRQTGIIDRAVSAGRRALREAEKRVPPDLRRQLQRQLKDADKMARAAISQLQIQARKASTRADVNSVLRRIDGLTKQARQIALGASARTSSKPAAKRKPAATRKAAPSRTKTTRRAAAPRRRRAPADEDVIVAPMAEIGE